MVSVVEPKTMKGARSNPASSVELVVATFPADQRPELAASALMNPLVGKMNSEPSRVSAVHAGEHSH